MPSEIMSQGHISSLLMPSSSFFSEEIRLPNERQFGIENLESVPDHSEGTTGTPMASSRANDLCTESGSLFVARNNVGLNRSHYENHLFSSSFSEIFDKKLRLLSSNKSFGQSATIMNSNLGKDEPFEPSEEIEAQAIGNLLPDDDDLLSDVVNDNGYGGKFCDRDDTDDIFFSGGGMEIEADDIFNQSRTSDYAGQEGYNGSEYSNSEHPSRTLFVRNISSNVEDAELNTLFEQFGDIQTLHTACKHQGFVMISYFDIRASCNAMRSLQDKTLKHQKLKIHFYIPKNNLSEEDTDHGTLVVLNLDSSLSNDDINQTFGIYGEIKEIREKQHKHPHKLIEFYDVRAAEAALCALNRSDIDGSKTKADSVHPGVARWCLSHESEQEEPSGCRQGSLPYNSPSGFYGSIQNDAIKSGNHYNGPIQGLYSGVPPSVSFPVRVTPAGNQINHGELSHSLGQLNVGFQHLPSFHSHSVPEYLDSVLHGFPYNSTSTISSMAIDPDGSRHIHRVGSGRINNHFENNEAGGFGVPSKYIRNIANSYHRQSPASMIWPNSPAFFNNVPARPLPQMRGFPGAPPHMLNSVLPLEHHHVGSAPAMNHYNQQDLLSLHPGSLGNRMFSCNSPIHRVKFATHGIFPHAGENYINPAHGVIHSPQDRSLMFHGRNTEVSPSFDRPNDRIRIRRSVANANHLDNKRQYELDIARITHGEDSRTTLMLKNIPNKYTSKMLLATIDEHNRGTYDFIYLPIDFKNKCNVGYAFINMINPQHIISFHQAFNGKKWEKFNSEKVVSLAYARIQGKTALIAHFQNSSLMNEDKQCRPILFHSCGPNVGDQEPFPMGDHIRSRPVKFRTAGNEDNHQESPSTSPKGEEDYIGTVSYLRSSKESE